MPRSKKVVSDMGLAVVYNPCSWCPYKEGRERCGMCELTFKRKKRISAEEEAPDFSNDTLEYFLKSLGYRKQSEWISVEERLPDCEYGSETEALLFRLKTGTVEAGYFGTGGRFRDKYFRCYHHASEGWDAKDVTHWMPLPEPPTNQ